MPSTSSVRRQSRTSSNWRTSLLGMPAPTKARSVPRRPVSTSRPPLTLPTSASAPTHIVEVLQNSPTYMVLIGVRVMPGVSVLTINMLMPA